MEALIQYGFQFSIAITLFYGLYLLILRNETFYNANRYYLIFGLILAVILPLFPISYVSPISLGSNADFFSLSDKYASDHTLAIEEGATQNTWTFIDFLIAFYVLGIIIFLARLIWQSLNVSKKIKSSDYIIIEGIKVIDQPDIMPYSFFNVVFIDIQKYSERELFNIIAHEKVHIQERHWIDLLIIELLTVLFWINPVVWLYEKSIKQNHEYLADQGVLLAGYSPGQYQALLINQLMGVKVLGFAHNLNFSLNKKRMKMMKKEKSPGANKMKLLLALPVIALLVFAFAKKEYVMVNADNLPSDLALTSEQNGLQVDLIKVKGKVIDDEGNPMTGANVVLKGTNTGTVVDRQGEFELEVPKSNKPMKGTIDAKGNESIQNANSLVVSFVGYGTVSVAFDSQSDAELNLIKMKKSVFNVKLPEAGDEEKLIKGDVVEVPPPPPPPKKGNKNELFTIVEDMPYFGKGGMYELAQEIKKETNWVMEKTKDRGETVVGFTVSQEGKVTNTHIVKSANSKMLDASAMKIITKLDNWNPGVQRGKKVPVDLTVPVKFN